jgi:hypothetical protein
MSQIPGPPPPQQPQMLPPNPMQQGARKQPAGGAKVVVAALSMALVAVVVLSVYIQGVKDQVASKQFTVFVLTRSVTPNSPMKDDWKEIFIPDTKDFREAFEEGLQAIMTEGTLKSKVQAGDKYEVSAASGSIITHVLFDKSNRSKDLAVEDGKVRIAIPIKSKTTPGGLRPGEYVDLAAPIQTGGDIPQVMIVMENLKVKAIGTHTLTDEGSSSGSRSNRSYSTVSFDVDQAIAVRLSTIEKMVRATGEFEIYIASASRPPSWDGGGINPRVMEVLEQLIPAN